MEYRLGIFSLPFRYHENNRICFFFLYFNPNCKKNSPDFLFASYLAWVMLINSLATGGHRRHKAFSPHNFRRIFNWESEPIFEASCAGNCLISSLAVSLLPLGIERFAVVK